MCCQIREYVPLVDNHGKFTLIIYNTLLTHVYPHNFLHLGFCVSVCACRSKNGKRRSAVMAWKNWTGVGQHGVWVGGWVSRWVFYMHICMSSIFVHKYTNKPLTGTYTNTHKGGKTRAYQDNAFASRPFREFNNPSFGCCI